MLRFYDDHDDHDGDGNDDDDNDDHNHDHDDDGGHDLSKGRLAVRESVDVFCFILKVSFQQYISEFETFIII